MAKFQDLYKQELHGIRELSKEFSSSHPSIAPMLREKSTDPDVERLLEGFAFISAQIQEIIDDQIPEFSGGLIKKFFPHYLRPLPSATIMSFKAKSELSEVFTVKKGSNFLSIPVDDTTCTFKLCSDCVIKPLEVQSANIINQSGEQAFIEIKIKLSGVNLSSWWTDSLSFHLGGNYSEAAQLYYILNCYIDKVVIDSPGAENIILPSSCISPQGFSNDESIIPYPGHANTSFRILQEYFLMPEKYLNIIISSLDSWVSRGDSDELTMRLYLSNQIKALPKITNSSFILHTASAINLFEYDAKPIPLDHKQYQYKIQVDTPNKNHYSIYRINEVQGYRQGQVQPKKYASIDEARHDGFDQSGYDIINKSSISGEGIDHYISIIYDDKVDIKEKETLSIKVECSNGHLPEHLSVAEICLPSNNSPTLLSFNNIYVPTTYKNPPEDNEWMWRLQSMLSINYLSIATADSLKSLLQFYLFLNKGEHITRINFQRQIDSIKDLKIETINRMVSGVLMRGQSIKIKCKISDFISEGEAFLFINIIDRFFSIYVALNSFTLLELTNSSTGEITSWPMRIGKQLLS